MVSSEPGQHRAALLNQKDSLGSAAFQWPAQGTACLTQPQKSPGLPQGRRSDLSQLPVGGSSMQGTPPSPPVPLLYCFPLYRPKE